MSVSFERARSISPALISYGISDVETGFGVSFTPDQRAALADIPFSDDTLNKCAETHLLFPSFPLSLLDIREKYLEHFCAKNLGCCPELGLKSSRDPLPVHWHLLRMDLVPDSYEKTWCEQLALLSPEEEVPSAALVAFATMLHYKMAGKRLFECTQVRTSDRAATGPFCVGYFDVAHGLNVTSYRVDFRSPYLGLSSARKS